MTLGAALAARSQRQALEAQARINRIMAEREDLNALQGAYRDWVRPPKFQKIGGRWWAVIEYGPSVPLVKRRRSA